eukprot:218579-Amphidinium_carterae.1
MYPHPSDLEALAFLAMQCVAVVYCVILHNSEYCSFAGFSFLSSEVPPHELELYPQCLSLQLSAEPYADVTILFFYLEG